MSDLPAVPAVTMQDVELESAELLPPRETLYRWGPPRHIGAPLPAWQANPGGPMLAA
jgi:hypothetical protein